MSDSHTPHQLSSVTDNKSHAKESSTTHTAGSHVQAAVTSGQVKGRLAATFNLTADEGKQLLGNPQGSSSHKKQKSGSKNSHGK